MEVDVALIQTESYTFLQDKENTTCAEPLAKPEAAEPPDPFIHNIATSQILSKPYSSKKRASHFPKEIPIYSSILKCLKRKKRYSAKSKLTS
ncbi:hypothetical protein [Sporomusa malonica]|uniref:hypothetical protein n=1 Tax=Sporomusa malonica TaxID=112901 RepID=UPI0015944E5C|nr:hypothetical protein [Sporomusa malonica]